MPPFIKNVPRAEPKRKKKYFRLAFTKVAIAAALNYRSNITRKMWYIS
jgi:hypothetical protein